jgi:peptide/nickel transport system substrate-binding protein
MKRLRWQLLVVILALAAIAVLLRSQQPALLPGVEITTPQPSEGGIYTEALIGQLGRLNPLLDYYNSVDRDVDRLIFSGLMAYDDRGLPHGDLAESWGISQDGKVYNFSIRSNAVWHDGQPVTSQDILFTVDLIRNDNIPLPDDLREFWNQVEVEELDNKTLQFRLPEPFAPFFDYLTFGILPKHILGDTPPENLIDAPVNLKPVGSGPYKFDQLIMEEGKIKSVVLSENEEYYGSQPFIDQVVFRYYPDYQSAFTAYQNQEVLGVSQIALDTLSLALKEPNINLHTGRVPRLGLVYLKLDDPALPFFQDANIRRALLMSINRQAIIDRLLAGQAIVADGPILPETWAYYEGIERIPYDPDLAVKMLKEAEYTVPATGGNVRAKEGIVMAFTLVLPDQEPYLTVAKAIQEYWSKIGVKADLKSVPYQELLTDYLEPGKYQAALVDLDQGRTPDPDPYPFWHQSQITGGQNYSHWDDRQASEYLERARVKDDLAERTKLYRNFQVRWTNQMPALPLYYGVYSNAIDSQVQGVRIGPMFDTPDRFTTLLEWYFTSRDVAEPQQTSTAVP